MTRDEDDGPARDDGDDADHDDDHDRPERDEPDGGDDEPTHPSYHWERGERARHEEAEPSGRPPRDRPEGERDRVDDGRQEPRPGDERRDSRPHDDRRREPPRTDRRPPDARERGVQTRDGVDWEFDQAPRDERARRRRPPEPGEPRSRERRAPPRTDRRRGSDGVTPIDFARKGAFDFAFSYPHQRGWGPVLKAGAVVLFSPLLVFLPLVFLFGYVFRVTRYAAQGRDQPAFEEFGEMLTDGVGYVVVFTLASLVWAFAFGIGSELHDAVGIVFALVGVYLFPAVLTVYPVTGSIATTATSSLTFDVAFTSHYLKHFLLSLLLLVALRIVASFTLLLLVVGVAWGWAFTYVSLGAYWGFVYHRGASEGLFPSAADVDQRNGY